MDVRSNSTERTLSVQAFDALRFESFRCVLKRLQSTTADGDFRTKLTQLLCNRPTNAGATTLQEYQKSTG